MNEPVPDFDLYAALSVTRDAPVEVILAAHRALIRRVHPDLHHGAAATLQAQRLNTARDWLADPERRRRYDLARQAGHAPGVVEPTAGRTPPDDLNARQAALDGLVDDCAGLRAIPGAWLDEACRRIMGAEPTLGNAADRLATVARAARREQLAARAAQDAAAHLGAGGGVREHLATMIRWTAVALAVSDLAPSDAGLVVGRWHACVSAARDVVRTQPRPWPVAAAGRIRGVARRLRDG